MVVCVAAVLLYGCTATPPTATCDEEDAEHLATSNKQQQEASS